MRPLPAAAATPSHGSRVRPGVTKLAKALLKAMDLATKTDDAREAMFGFISGTK